MATLLHVVLLLVVLGQVVYLASRYRCRVDLTSDQLWSSTESTRNLLDRLDQRLVIEAYFSPKEKLPVLYRTTRAWADNFLDEVVQLGKGKVVLQRFDPNADKAISDKATRLAIKPLELKSSTSTSLSVDLHWQGLRLVYGGGKQKVIPQFTPTTSWVAEALLTPAIKEVATATKRKFGFMEWPISIAGGQGPTGVGWNLVRTHEGISKRYEFQNYKDEDGTLLPQDVDTLFLFRPKDLTDRQKYVLDQFVVRGGTLLVLADACEYSIGQQRAFTRVPLALDAAGSQHQFVNQLSHYGIDWKPKLVADMTTNVQQPRDPLRAPFEYLALAQQTRMGFQQSSPVGYPYFFHPLAYDWALAADEFARDDKRQVDKAAADEYRQRFVPGMPSDDFLFKNFKQAGRGPGFYWPTWVGLRQRAGGVLDLPAGVAGSVLLWSSPAALIEDPPPTVNPLGFGTTQQRTEAYQKFVQPLADRMRSEPRQQAPLMVEVKGVFASYFAGLERPKRPTEIVEEEAKKKAAEAEKEAAAAAAADPDAGPQPEKKPDAPVPPAAAPEAAFLAQGTAPGRVIVIGDADFLRDDFLRGDYAQAGGPFSGMMGLPFWAQLLDWLAEDKDLVALQSRTAVDRTLKFSDTVAAPRADPRLAEQQLRAKTTFLRALNVLLPSGVLVLFGLLVFLARRRQKLTFLASLR